MLKAYHLMRTYLRLRVPFLFATGLTPLPIGYDVFSSAKPRAGLCISGAGRRSAAQRRRDPRPCSWPAHPRFPALPYRPPPQVVVQKVLDGFLSTKFEKTYLNPQT